MEAPSGIKINKGQSLWVMDEGQDYVDELSFTAMVDFANFRIDAEAAEKMAEWLTQYALWKRWKDAQRALVHKSPEELDN